MANELKREKKAQAVIGKNQIRTLPFFSNSAQAAQDGIGHWTGRLAGVGKCRRTHYPSTGARRCAAGQGKRRLGFPHRPALGRFRDRQSAGSNPRFTSMGIVGGAVYDALLAACALKAKAETLLSWNLRHYG